MTFERGPLLTYEVTWTSGHIETIQAHQCIMPNRLPFDPPPTTPERVMFHGEIDGHWQLLLAAPEADIQTVRNVTTREALS